MRFTFTILVFAALMFLVPFKVLASNTMFPETSDAQISEALGHVSPIRILPDSGFYFVITVKEMATRVFQPSSVKRAEFDMVLAGKRLREAYDLKKKGDLKRTYRTLAKYSERSRKVMEGFEKAKSQNQATDGLTAQIIEDLKSHEVLLAAIAGGEQELDQEVKRAREAFVELALSMDRLAPGAKNRFKTVSMFEEEKKANEVVLPTPKPTPEATPSFKPRRIIY